MKLTMLGSGGVTPTPRPTCECHVCQAAHANGIPNARTGASLFLHNGNVLFDTPEEVRLQLTRERIQKVEQIILTHWHPDHTHGIRVLEALNWNFAENQPYLDEPIQVYISLWQHEQMKKYTCGSFLEYYQDKGMIDVVYLEDRKPIRVEGGVTITPYIIEKTKGFYFLIDDGGKKVIYVPCEYHGFVPDPSITNLDIFIVHNLFWENPNISPRTRVPEDEDTFEQMLTHADSFGTKNIILTHIEESFGLTHEELNQKMKEYYTEYNVVAGYDGLVINI